MKMKNAKKIVAILLACVMLFALTACGNDSEDTPTAGKDKEAAEPITLRFSHHASATSTMGQYITQLCKDITEATEGRVIVEDYPGATLGAANEAMSMLDTGTCDIAMISPSAYPAQFPCANLVSLPMLGFTNVGQMCNAIWDVYEAYPEAFAPAFEGYHMWVMYMGSMGVLATTEEVNSIADMKNMNIRTFNDLTTKVLTAAEANPISIGSPDIYSAMEKGVCEGYMFDIGGIYGWNLNDVTDYCYDCGLFTVPGFFLMSEKAWNSLSAEDQAIFDSFGLRAGSLKFTVEANDADNTAGIEQLGDKYIQLQPGDTLYDELVDISETVVNE